MRSILLAVFLAGLALAGIAAAQSYPNRPVRIIVSFPPGTTPDTVARVVPYWESAIAPAVRAGRRVLVAAHGNSLRALVKHLDGVSDTDIVGLNIPTGVPLVYELDERLKPLKRSYLGDADEIARRIAAVAAQGKAKA